MVLPKTNKSRLFKKLLIMKKLLFVMMLALVIASCKKDEPPKVDGGYVNYRGKNYTTNKMVVIRNAAYPFYSVYDIGFAPSTITYDSGEKKFVGKGVGMRLSLFLPDSTYTLPSGTYPNVQLNLTTNFFMDCRILLEEADWNGYTTERVKIPKGTLKISKTGSTYTFNFTGSDDEDNEVKAYFKGAIKNYVINDEKK